MCLSNDRFRVHSGATVLSTTPGGLIKKSMTWKKALAESLRAAAESQEEECPDVTMYSLSPSHLVP